MDAERIQDIFSAFGPVTVRRMFGGAGIYADGTMFALVDEGVIYLKGNESLIPDFEKAGSTPFCYSAKGGRKVVMSYWRMPEGLYDDPEELARWAKRSLAAAQQSASRKGRNPKGKPQGRARRIRRD